MLLLGSVLALLSTATLATASPLEASNSNATTTKKRQAYSGVATICYQNGIAGSCGTVHSDYALIVALGTSWWALGNYCNRWVKIINAGPAGDNSIGGRGNVVYAMVEDTCASWDATHVDLSLGVWHRLTNRAPASVVGIDWYFCPTDSSAC